MEIILGMKHDIQTKHQDHNEKEATAQ